jgi:flavin-dependent dehydrogenase
MIQEVRQYDEAVVWASEAGSTAAKHFARAGLKVALIELRQEIDAYR